MTFNRRDSFQGGSDERPVAPLTMGKSTLMAALAGVGMPLSLNPDSLLRSCAAFGSIRRDLDARCGQGPGLCELDGHMLFPLVPAALGQWPVWYVRLPHSWATEVPHLTAQAHLRPHLMRDPLDPWNVVQWVSILSNRSPDGGFAGARRIDIDTGDIAWTLDEGVRCGGVLVLLECASGVSVTAYPIDDSLTSELQAGDVASSRHPLFDLSLAEVQALTRALEDGCLPTSDPNVLRMQCTRLGQPEVLLERRLNFQRRAQLTLHAAGSRVRYGRLADGALGSIDAGDVWWLEQWKRNRATWLTLTVPTALHSRVSQEGMQVQVKLLPAAGGAPAMVVVLLVCGGDVLAGELSLAHNALRQSVQSASKAGWLRLALVNFRNGRALVTAIGWPQLALSSMEFAAGEEKGGVFGVAHPDVTSFANAVAQELGETVSLHRCRILPSSVH